MFPSECGFQHCASKPLAYRSSKLRGISVDADLTKLTVLINLNCLWSTDMYVAQAWIWQGECVRRAKDGLQECTAIPVWLVSQIQDSPGKDFTVTLGSVHATPDKLWNASLFSRLGLPSTLIRRDNGTFQKRSSNRRNFENSGFSSSPGSRENILKKELFQNKTSR